MATEGDRSSKDLHKPIEGHSMAPGPVSMSPSAPDCSDAHVVCSHPDSRASEPRATQTQAPVVLLRSVSCAAVLSSQHIDAPATENEFRKAPERSSHAAHPPHAPSATTTTHGPRIAVSMFARDSMQARAALKAEGQSHPNSPPSMPPHHEKVRENPSPDGGWRWQCKADQPPATLPATFSSPQPVLQPPPANRLSRPASTHPVVLAAQARLAVWKGQQTATPASQLARDALVAIPRQLDLGHEQWDHVEADLGLNDGEPWIARAGTFSASESGEFADSSAVREPLHRLSGGVRRAMCPLLVSSTRLQEAVRVSLDNNASRQAQSSSQVQTPDLGMKIKTLKISKLAAELSGLVMIGKGGGGLVCWAQWQGAPVAVKFMAGTTPGCMNMGALEGMLAASVHHPNVVQTYGFDVTCVSESSFEQPRNQLGHPRMISAAVARIEHDLALERASIRFRDGSSSTASDAMVRFDSEDGFGEPAELPADGWTVPQVLQALDVRPGMHLTHIIMEHCDHGSLLSALQRGLFYARPASDPTSRFSERVVLRGALRTAQDICRGMQHLHAAGIVHGDLKPGNVLLKGSRVDRRGFTAKVADFGLSKVVTGDVPVEMRHWSTVTHMAPEVIRGVWCKKSDVYSFGVLLWQLICCEPEPFKGMTVQEVLMLAMKRRLRLQWPAHCHPSVAKLGAACMAFEPHLRPTFEEIGDVLVYIERNIRHEVRCHMSN